MRTSAVKVLSLLLQSHFAFARLTLRVPLFVVPFDASQQPSPVATTPVTPTVSSNTRDVVVTTAPDIPSTQQQSVQLWPSELGSQRTKSPGSALGGLASRFRLSAFEPSPAFAADLRKGEDAFTKNCVACHAGGGNVVARSKGLFKGDLEKNKMLNREKIYEITYYGKGVMPGYGRDCKPQRMCTYGEKLSDSQMESVVDYVLEKANNGW
uniref:Cytochrome c-553 n=1 Tax=Chromera velia CCMP2878 TaxID=1169474 RepID=A0A0G4I271_9ALVE|eukprot:Cvel_10327.t1-p1 / transcript=Cvel_10327.t1 / gene=Cvel_10327 / organism=Chromera_velia_CCMP2878 / gene_product=Cytochrome c6, chloroplastic, putative / transcript_product=Cytochrome c6, chloroplastic, putative / location=Cvel_scaffold620:33307-36872(-) / protein_length=209 / sequence_SO=supercontig / SO=protein_coding / is_pseudo=false